MVSPNNLITNCHNNYCKYDYHKYDADLPLYKFDPFTKGAYVNKCVNEKLFPCCKFFWHGQHIDLFMALVFDNIGMNGKRPDNTSRQNKLTWSKLEETTWKGAGRHNKTMWIKLEVATWIKDKSTREVTTRIKLEAGKISAHNQFDTVIGIRAFLPTNGINKQPFSIKLMGKVQRHQ